MKSEYLYLTTLAWIGVCVGIQALVPATAGRSWGEALRRLARRPAYAFVALAGLSLALNTLLGVFVGIPQPFIHDEFAYLLSAETFAQGRLTNPTPQGWEHFEAVHVLLQPSYNARYLPGTSLTLALGLVLTGYPIVGVWLSCALCCSLTYWALLPRLRPETAFLVALLFLLCPQLRTWGQNYWGGSLTVCASALVLGAALRQRLGATLGIGIALLLVTRPFEGALFCGVLLGYLGRPVRHTGSVWRGLLGFILPIATVVLALGIYNRAVTGSAWELPYRHYQQQYDSAPLFAVQAEFPPKAYQSPFVADFWRYIAQGYHWARTHALGTSVTKLVDFLQLILMNPVLVLALLYGVWRRSCARELGAIAGFFLVLVIDTFAWSHYAAPIFPLVCLAVGKALEERVWEPTLFRLVVGAAVVGYLVNVVAYQRWYQQWRPVALLQKTRLQAELERRPQPVAVFLRYVPNRQGDLWLYNASQPHTARVLWLSSLGEPRDRAFLDHYPDREAYLLDIATQRLVPYLREARGR